MNEDELELRLRETQLRAELQRRVVPSPAPASLVRYVAGLGGAAAAGDGEMPVSSAVRSRGAGRGAGVLGGLATAACIVVLLAAGLSWRTSHQAAALESSSPGASGDWSIPGPTSSEIPSIAPTPSPTQGLSWTGRPGQIQQAETLDGQFGYAVAAHEAEPNAKSPGTDPKRLYLTYDGGATWVDRSPDSADGGYLYLHFADRMNAWFLGWDQVGNSKAGDALYSTWVYRTSDGGLHWAKYTLPSDTLYMATYFNMDDGRDGVISMFARDQNQPREGYAPGSAPLVGARAGLASVGKTPLTTYQQLWITSDGGATWKKAMDTSTNPKQAATFPQAPVMASATELWSGGSSASGAPISSHSTDGGQSWTTAVLPLPKGYASESQQDLPSGSGDQLSLMGSVSTANDGVHAMSWAYVVWSSGDGGVSWKIASSTALGQQSSVGPLEGTVGTSWESGAWKYVGVFPVNSQKSVTYFDVDSPATKLSFDGSGVCTSDEAYFILASIVSPRIAWAACRIDGATPWLGHQYLYSTTDGGSSWRPLMGAP